MYFPLSRGKPLSKTHVIRTKIGLLRGGVLLILFVVLVGCGGTPQQDTGKTPVLTPTPLPSPTAPIAPTPQGISLRSQALEVLESEMLKVFGVDNNWRPLTYITHDFEDQGDVVVDHATGLMWQKSGSTAPMSYAQAQAYIAQLNQDWFAGYTDWRLPTMAELLSLVEPQAQANGFVSIRCLVRSKSGVGVRTGFRPTKSARRERLGLSIFRSAASTGSVSPTTMCAPCAPDNPPSKIKSRYRFLHRLFVFYPVTF